MDYKLQKYLQKRFCFNADATVSSIYNRFLKDKGVPRISDCETLFSYIYFTYSNRVKMAEKGVYPPLPQEHQVGSSDAPPSYDATMTAGAAGGFAEPGKNQSYPAPMPHQQAAFPPTQTVIVQQTITLGHRPVNMVCPHCQAQIRTSTDSEPSATAWVLGAILCLLCWPLSCVPCCIDSLQDVTHKCPNCRRVIGMSKGG